MITSLSSGPLLQQPFVVGPGFSQFRRKRLAKLLPASMWIWGTCYQSTSFKPNRSHKHSWTGLVFLPSAKKQRRRIEDIVTWSEAFTIFTLILTSYFLHRWKDLTSYKLLILRTYRQFSGRVWLAYDQAFRQHAAATKLVDWWTMKFNSKIFTLLGPLCVLSLVVP